MEKPREVQKVVRKTASSGKVDYAPPVVLNETSKSKLQALAWFIPHSDGRTTFSLKLEGLVKSKGQPFIEDKTKTLTLSELRPSSYLNTYRHICPLPLSRKRGSSS